MKRIGPLLSGIFSDLGIGDRMKLEKLRREWLGIFHEPMSVHTFPSEIKDGELLITVDSPIWLQQLGFFKRDILTKLVGFDIKSVRFRHGRITRDDRVSSLRSGSNETKPVHELRDSEIAWIDKTVSDIEDDELKDAVRKAIEKAFRQKY
jgi:hypothetical protein